MTRRKSQKRQDGDRRSQSRRSDRSRADASREPMAPKTRAYLTQVVQEDKLGKQIVAVSPCDGPDPERHEESRFDVAPLLPLARELSKLFPNGRHFRVTFEPNALARYRAGSLRLSKGPVLLRDAGGRVGALPVRASPVPALGSVLLSCAHALMSTLALRDVEAQLRAVFGELKSVKRWLEEDRLSKLQGNWEQLEEIHTQILAGAERRKLAKLAQPVLGTMKLECRQLRNAYEGRMKAVLEQRETVHGPVARMNGLAGQVQDFEAVARGACLAVVEAVIAQRLLQLLDPNPRSDRVATRKLEAELNGVEKLIEGTLATFNHRIEEVTPPPRLGLFGVVPQRDFNAARVRAQRRTNDARDSLRVAANGARGVLRAIEAQSQPLTAIISIDRPGKVAAMRLVGPEPAAGIASKSGSSSG